MNSSLKEKYTTISSDISEIIKFDNVDIGYVKGQPVVSNLNFSIPAGSSFGIIGPNGSGKTTLLKTILGFIKPLSGHVIKSCLLQKPGSVGYVPQFSNIDELFPLSVYEIVEMGMLYKCSSMSIRCFKNVSYEVEQALKKVGLYEYKNSLFRDLSGGMKQRVLIAKALVSDAVLLVLDEPTRGLDLKQTNSILDFLDNYRKENNISIIMVSHILSDFLYHTDFLLILNEGKQAFYGSTKSLSKDVLLNLYGEKCCLSLSMHL